MDEVSPYRQPFELALDRGPTTKVEITEAAADVVAAWDFDQRVVAVHESAHAVVAAALGVPVKAVDITSRGGGHTEIGTATDNLPSTTTGRMILDQIVVRLAALQAERVIFGEGTTGSADDMAAATALAYERMRAGLDPNGSRVAVDGIPYWAGVTEELKTQMLAAVDATLTECSERTIELVTQRHDSILTFAGHLYERRRLEGEVLQALLAEVKRA